MHFPINCNQNVVKSLITISNNGDMGGLNTQHVFPYMGKCENKVTLNNSLKQQLWTLFPFCSSWHIIGSNCIFYISEEYFQWDRTENICFFYNFYEVWIKSENKINMQFLLHFLCGIKCFVFYGLFVFDCYIPSTP